MPTVTEPGVETHRAHALLVADTERHRRRRASGWVGRELAAGSKVYYKGWPAESPRAEDHWLAGPEGPAGAATALASGQLELLDFPSVVERCGGTSEGLLRLQTDEVERALEEGWSSVAMSQESTHRPMADADEIAEFVTQEGGYDLLAARWPVRTLCQLTLAGENDAAVRSSLAVHHGAVVAPCWSSSASAGRWRLHGELDAYVVRQFAAAAQGALRSGSCADLHVDLADVDFIDASCVRTLLLVARSTSRDQNVVLHGLSPAARRLVEALDPPPSVLVDGAPVG